MIMRIPIGKYFKIVGSILLICFLINFICLLIYIVPQFASFDLIFKVTTIIGLIQYLFFGPALGLLFIFYRKEYIIL